MREQDTFEPDDDPYDETPIEEDLPDEAEEEKHICLDCGNILLWTYFVTEGYNDWFCPECDD